MLHGVCKAQQIELQPRLLHAGVKGTSRAAAALANMRASNLNPMDMSLLRGLPIYCALVAARQVTLSRRAYLTLFATSSLSAVRASCMYISMVVLPLKSESAVCKCLHQNQSVPLKQASRDEGSAGRCTQTFASIAILASTQHAMQSRAVMWFPTAQHSTPGEPSCCT
jgi:hypothetical protein